MIASLLKNWSNIGNNIPLLRHPITFNRNLNALVRAIATFPVFNGTRPLCAVFCQVFDLILHKLKINKMKEIIIKFFVRKELVKDKLFMQSFINRKLNIYLNPYYLKKHKLIKKYYTPYNSKQIRGLFMVTIKISFQMVN